MKKLLPLLLALVGLGVGAGGGYVLRPPPGVGVAANPCGDVAAAAAAHAADTPADSAARAYVKLNNQFVIPVVEGGRVSALVILSLSLEVSEGGSEQVYAAEPRLRDAFLQALFNHANTGGFRGAFTEAATLDVLRRALLEAARKTLGQTVRDVLIVDIVRQDNA